MLNCYIRTGSSFSLTEGGGGGLKLDKGLFYWSAGYEEPAPGIFLFSKAFSCDIRHIGHYVSPSV